MNNENRVCLQRREWSEFRGKQMTDWAAQRDRERRCLLPGGSQFQAQFPWELAEIHLNGISIFLQPLFKLPGVSSPCKQQRFLTEMHTPYITTLKKLPWKEAGSLHLRHGPRSQWSPCLKAAKATMAPSWVRCCIRKPTLPHLREVCALIKCSMILEKRVGGLKL